MYFCQYLATSSSTEILQQHIVRFLMTVRKSKPLNNFFNVAYLKPERSGTIIPKAMKLKYLALRWTAGHTKIQLERVRSYAFVFEEWLIVLFCSAMFETIFFLSLI